MIWFILGVTISFTRFKITRSYENIYCKTVPFFSLFFFFFLLHLWFLSFKVNDLSTTITTTKKPWFSCVFPGEWKQTQGGEGGKERLVLLNFSLRVRLALSSVSLEKCNIDTCSAVCVIFREIHGYCSFSLAMSRYPTNHAI